MAGKRRWRLWTGRFIKELNGMSGLASLGGAILAFISFGGWNAFSGTLAAITGGIGILTTVIAIAIAAYKAIPPIFRHPDELIGQRLSLDKLDNIYPPLSRLGVVGPSMVGKTTLLKRILQQVPPYQRTLEVHAYVAVLQRTPILYLAMLDGPGQGFAHQFTI